MTQERRVNMRWSWGLGLIWLALILWPSTHRGIEGIAPVEYWFSVTGIEVEDTVAGVCPTVVVTRNIKRPFRAAWRVQMIRREATGYSAWGVPWSGESVYRPDAVLPALTDLAWWAGYQNGDEVCAFEPGMFRMVVEWTLELPAGSQKITRVTSNSFRVYPPCAPEIAGIDIICETLQTETPP